MPWVHLPASIGPVRLEHLHQRPPVRRTTHGVLTAPGTGAQVHDATLNAFRRRLLAIAFVKMPAATFRRLDQARLATENVGVVGKLLGGFGSGRDGKAPALRPDFALAEGPSASRRSP